MDTNGVVKELADLARLELTSDELANLERQIPDIIDYIKKLQELDTSSVPPAVYLNDLQNVFRDDQAEPCSEETRQAILRAFPDRSDDLLRVQGVFEDKDELL